MIARLRAGDHVGHLAASSTFLTLGQASGAYEAQGNQAALISLHPTPKRRRCAGSCRRHDLALGHHGLAGP